MATTTNAATSATSSSSLNPYMANLAQFAQMYGATDASSFYNSPSIFMNSMMMDPSMSMMAMCNPMMAMNPMMNPMMSQMLNPQAYDARQRGINPMDSFFFGKDSEKFAKYNQENVNIQDGLRLLAEYAAADNQDDFKSAYDNLVNAQKQRIKSLQPNISGADLDVAARTQINNQFAQMSGGISLSQALKHNGDNCFWQGIKDILSCGYLNDKRTVQENIAHVDGVVSTQRKREKAVQWVGRGVATAGLLVGGGKMLVMKGKHPYLRTLGGIMLALGSIGAIGSATKS